MPTYVYECSKCGHRFELFQRISDAPRKRCPECRGAVKRVITAGAGLIFKGSGFYATDYRSKEYREREKKERSTAGSGGQPEKESGAGSSGSRERKPAGSDGGDSSGSTEKS